MKIYYNLFTTYHYDELLTIKNIGIPQKNKIINCNNNINLNSFKLINTEKINKSKEK